MPEPAPEATTFAALGVSEPVIHALARAGITEPFPIQVLTIPDALAGKDICGKARTGSGKTLAFGIPLVERTRTSKPNTPRSLVLAPTRELANQIAEALVPLAAARRIWIAAIFGGASMNRQVSMLRAGVDIVIATPGRLNDLLDRGLISVAEVETVVLDEADQMADMGFLPQVEAILDRIETRHQTLLFSATLDGDIDRLVKRYQHEPVFMEVPVPEGEAETIAHRFIGVNEAEKVAVAASIAAGPERTLMFVRTQRGADRLVAQLAREGVAADALHGGLNQNKRERVLQAFSRGTAPVLVATNLAARGIHVDGVDIVLHFDPPEEHKTYLHRSGRTARAGASGVVVTLVAPHQERDVNALRRLASLREAVVPMGPTDARLGDLTGWQPPLDDHSLPPSARHNQQQGSPRPWNNRRRPEGAPNRGPRRFAGAPHRAEGDSRPDRRGGSRAPRA